MEYIHPKHYKGLKVDTPNSQKIRRNIVEKYCLKCDLFMGKDHDFSECQIYDKWKNGKAVKKKTCPFPYIAVSLIDPKLKCKVEE